MTEFGLQKIEQSTFARLVVDFSSLFSVTTRGVGFTSTVVGFVQQEVVVDLSFRIEGKIVGFSEILFELTLFVFVGQVDVDFTDLT